MNREENKEDFIVKMLDIYDNHKGGLILFADLYNDCVLDNVYYSYREFPTRQDLKEELKKRRGLIEINAGVNKTGDLYTVVKESSSSIEQVINAHNIKVVARWALDDKQMLHVNILCREEDAFKVRLII